MDHWRPNDSSIQVMVYTSAFGMGIDVANIDLVIKAFTTIGYVILRAKSEEDVLSHFRVLGGEEPLTTAISILPKSLVLKEYQSIYKKENWSACSHWSKWWMRPTHLGE